MKINAVLITSILITTTLLSGTILASTLVFADNDSVVDEINITVPVSCTLSGSGMTSHTASIPNGTYTPDIGTTTLTAFCNDNAGFSIYAAGYTGDEIGGTNSTKLVGTSASNNATIDTGTAIGPVSGNDTSNWAMKLTAVSSPTPTYPITITSDTSGSFSSYHAVPSEYTKVATRTSGTDIGQSAEGSTLTTTYAAYISKTQAADTYTGQVIYTLVHPASAPAPVVCNPNGTTISTIKCMQDFAGPNHDTIIASMVPEQQYTLKDKRDSKTYTIAKYQVGNTENYDVWMTQNLDLDLDAGITYTNEDTDIGYNTTTNTYGTASWNPIRSTYQPTSTQTHEWCQGGTWDSQYGYCEDNNTPESYDPGDLYWNGAESDYSDWGTYYNSCDYSTSTPVCDQSKNPISTYVSSTSSTPQYHLGNYYNWTAALATNDSSVYDGESLVEQSICPAGWTIPRNDYHEDTFYSLWNQYGFNESSINGSNKLWISPLYFAASGNFDGYLNGVGNGGAFWSPVAGGSVSARFADFLVDGYIVPSDDSLRPAGYSIRCVLRPVVSSDPGKD